MSTRAVIFDLYGTLVKQPSMDVRRSLLAEMAACHGHPRRCLRPVSGSEGFWERQVGVYGTEERHLEYIAGRVGVAPDPQRVARAAARSPWTFDRESLEATRLGRGGHAASAEGCRPAAGAAQQLRRRHPEGLG